MVVSIGLTEMNRLTKVNENMSKKQKKFKLHLHITADTKKGIREAIKDILSDLTDKSKTRNLIYGEKDFHVDFELED